MRPALADSQRLRWRLVKPEIHMCKLKVSKKYVLGPLSVTVRNISYE